MKQLHTYNTMKLTHLLQINQRYKIKSVKSAVCLRTLFWTVSLGKELLYEVSENVF